MSHHTTKEQPRAIDAWRSPGLRPERMVEIVPFGASASVLDTGALLRT
jgi:hypothetical protein